MERRRVSAIRVRKVSGSEEGRSNGSGGAGTLGVEREAERCGDGMLVGDFEGL